MGDLLKLAGLGPGDQVSDEMRAALVAHARQFLLAGAPLSLAAWAALAPVEREAFAAAGQALAVERDEVFARALASVRATKTRAELFGVELVDGGL